jgi:hypothetical protein
MRVYGSLHPGIQYDKRVALFNIVSCEVNTIPYAFPSRCLTQDVRPVTLLGDSNERHLGSLIFFFQVLQNALLTYVDDVLRTDLIGAAALHVVQQMWIVP